MSIPNTCWRCKFFLNKGNTRDEGYCKRYPPHQDKTYVLVRSTSWCGEFKEKEDVWINGRKI